MHQITVMKCKIFNMICLCKYDNCHCYFVDFELISGKNKPMWIVVLLVLFLMLIFYVLFVSIVVTINTNKDQYEIQFSGLAKACVEQHNKELLRIRLEIFRMIFYFYPLKKIHVHKGREKVKKNTQKNTKRLSIRKIVSIMRTFKIERLIVDLDTGDNVVNAKLYPLFGFLNYHVGTFNINFENRNQFVLRMHNRPINIIKSFINK